MSKADNMLAILWLLKANKRMTAKQLADALEMHIRTVYRYIDALCASGVPIVADSGHNGGYSLLEQFKTSPLFFNAAEQKALVQAAVFAQEAGYPYSEELKGAMVKLKRYTNAEQRIAMEHYLDGFEVISSGADMGMENTLRQLELAVSICSTLLIKHQKGYGMDPQQRQLVSRRLLPSPPGHSQLPGRSNHFDLDHGGCIRASGKLLRTELYAPGIKALGIQGRRGAHPRHPEGQARNVERLVRNLAVQRFTGRAYEGRSPFPSG